jgi:hypothetical protein
MNEVALAQWGAVVPPPPKKRIIRIYGMICEFSLIHGIGIQGRLHKKGLRNHSSTDYAAEQNLVEKSLRGFVVY